MWASYTDILGSPQLTSKQVTQKHLKHTPLNDMLETQSFTYMPQHQTYNLYSTYIVGICTDRPTLSATGMER